MKRITLLLVLLAAAHIADAQSLGILSYGLSVNPDTVSFNETVDFSLLVTNTGNSVFNGKFTIEYLVNDSFQGVLDSMSNIVQIQAGTSFPLTIPGVVISSPMYSVGDNIVVIWPVAEQAFVPTTDSGTVNIVVETELSTSSSLLKKNVQTWYISPGKTLFIDYGTLKNEIASVSLFDVSGRKHFSYANAIDHISLAELPSQLYLLVIRTRDEECISFKIAGF